MTQYLYYIRLLKPPPNVIVPGQQFSIVWTIDNDLGEMPFLQPLSVTCHLLSNNPATRFASTSSKSIKLEYDPYKGGGMVRSNLTITGTLQHPLQQQIQLVLTCSNNNSIKTGSSTHSTWYLAQQASDDTWIIPVWSQPVHLGRSSDMETSRECERQLIVGPDNKIVKIHESTSHTMAHHVWDCGIWLCHYLAHYTPTKQYNHVLELGSGTAIAGIYAAHALSPTCMYLTDLPEAVSSIQGNVDIQQWDNHQRVVVEALEWGQDGQQVMDNEELDLVIISDLLYNQSSHDVLIDTLKRLMDRHSGLQTLLIYKPRYPNEERAFFDKIQKLGWRCTMDTTTVDCSPCEVYWIDIGEKKGCSLC